MRASLAISKQAEKDIDEILDYIYSDNPNSALALYDKIYSKFLFLTEFPTAGIKREELYFDLRSYPSDNYIIFYTTDYKRVEIRRVLHTSRNINPEFFNN